MTNPLLTATCSDQERRLDIAEPTSGFNGIDYVEIDAVDQRVLTIGFLHPLPGETDGVPAGPALTLANLVIEGGERITGIVATAISSSGRDLTVTVDRAGDFTPYVVRIVASAADDSTPAGFDPALSAAAFSFKAACRSKLDCRPPTGNARSSAAPDVFLDHLARDYEGVRGLMLDRLATLVPGLGNLNPADTLVATAEALAAAADQRAYRQDAIGTEAHLGTARRHVSVRRHVRLLDYSLHDGCSAQTWICLDVEDGSQVETVGLPTGTVLLTSGPGPTMLDAEQTTAALATDAVAFETLHPIAPLAARNEIEIHTWGGTSCKLPVGSTSATLVNDPALDLSAGDLVLFEEVRSPATGRTVDADPSRRQVVRLTAASPSSDPVMNLDLVEVAWSRADALQFDLHVTTEIDGGAVGAQIVAAVARANVVAAHHGRMVSADLEISQAGRWRPVLSDEPIAAAVSFDPKAAAVKSLVQDPQKARPVVSLSSAEGNWSARADLLAADRFDRGFVVETERDGVARLRFGDDVHGRRPPAGIVLTASWLAGGGRAGNVGREVLGRISTSVAGVTALRNPLPAVGGTDPETLEHARQHAPAAFLTQERAVNEADWVEVALRQSEVQDAVAHLRWTGSWWTVFVTLDLYGGGRLLGDPALADDLRSRLDRFRIAGYDLELRDPVDLAIDLTLRICVADGHFRSAVRRYLRTTFSTLADVGDGPGFFHPDLHTIGGSVYVSQIVAHAAGVPGVRAAEVAELRPVGTEVPGTDPAVTAGVLVAGDIQVIRLSNDPTFPEHGMLQLDMEGGL